MLRGQRLHALTPLAALSSSCSWCDSLLMGAFRAVRPRLRAQAGERDGEDSNTSVSHFCPTSRRIMQFSTGKTAPLQSRVVYIGGAFDMFHAGHVQALEHARSFGDFLLVGVHTDDSVQQRRGPHLPILSLHERSLSVLSCKYVDEVIIGAPWVVTQDLLTTFNVSVVVSGAPGPQRGAQAARRTATEADAARRRADA